jgi:hypothetical protein
MRDPNSIAIKKSVSRYAGNALTGEAVDPLEGPLTEF